MSHEREDAAWRTLLAQSRPAFQGETEPPFGFVTAATARVMAERRQRDVMEKIGLRALIASLAALGLAAAVTVFLEVQDSAGLEPGVRSLAYVENVPLS